MANELGPEMAGQEAHHLGTTVWFVGIGKLILAGLTLVLALTGYDTPRPVNTWFFWIGVNLLILGSLCLSLGKVFDRASREPVPHALGEALRKANKLFGYYLCLISLGVLALGYATAMFLGKILSR